MSGTGAGLGAMVVACVVWGLSPIYYKAMADVPPLEVLSHRTIWSLVIFGAILAAQGRLGALAALLGPGRARRSVALAAGVVSVNWGVFIWSVQAGHVVEASLGYYIFPLISVLLGWAVLGERLSPMQGGAVAVVAAAVLILTAGLGVPPWISLILAGSFGLYGLIKKRLEANPVVSVTGEVALLAPLALIWLFGAHWLGWTGGMGGMGGTGDMGQTGAGQMAGAFGRDPVTSALLMSTGAMTAGPLILFSYASRRLSMATVGLMQYINPTLQFLCATMIFSEPFSLWHGGAFALIWIALAAYTYDSLIQEKASRNARRKASTSS